MILTSITMAAQTCTGRMDATLSSSEAGKVSTAFASAVCFRACAVSYPAAEREGLLWVWPSAGPGEQAAAQAALPRMAIAPEIDSSDTLHLADGWYFR